MNLYKISKFICLKSLPVILCISATLLFLPTVSVKQIHVVRNQCEDSRVLKLQQRYRDCSLLVEFFFDGEARMREEPGVDPTVLQQTINEYRIIQDALLVQLDCIYQKEIKYSK